MAEIIRMPRLSDTMEEGVIIGWQKKVGDPVKPGDILAEVETDKATMELESFHEGFLLHIGIESGPVPVDGIIAVIGEKGEDFQSLLQESATKQSDKQNNSHSTSQAAAESPAVEAKAEPHSDPSPADTRRIKASPLAKKIAEAAGIPLGHISGTGDHGRIVKRDVELALKSEPAPTLQSTTHLTLQTQGYQDTPVSQMRKTIARRLAESKFSAPHFYLTVEIDMDQCIEARKALNSGTDIKVSFNDIVIKAVASALRRHPAINSSWMNDKIRFNKDIHIGVAVAVEDGLLVPVIRHTDYKSLSQINQEVKSLAEKAKSKKLSPEEMQGNTFTISNLGMFGIEEFTAIINPPDACILAVGGIVTKPVVKDGAITIGNTMKVTLSCDHRVVDGATGAKFLQTLKELLEEPIRLLA